MQNIGAAALFLPVVSRISARTGIPLSRLLMPMGFCAILGGTMTMIGSSPLILLNDLLLNANEALPDGVAPMRTFHLFAVTPIGIVMLTAGIAYFVVLGSRLLPVMDDNTADTSTTAQYFEELYGLKGDIFEAAVPANSPLVGQSIGDAEAIPDAPFVLGMRVGRDIALEPPIDEPIPAGATFALMGSQEQVRRFARTTGLSVARDMQAFVEVLNPTRAGVSEVVIPPASNVAGAPSATWRCAGDTAPTCSRSTARRRSSATTSPTPSFRWATRWCCTASGTICIASSRIVRSWW